MQTGTSKAVLRDPARKGCTSPSVLQISKDGLLQCRGMKANTRDDPAHPAFGTCPRAPHTHTREPCPTRMGTDTCSAPVLGPEGPAWMHSLAKPYLHVPPPPACPVTCHKPVEPRRPPQALLYPRRSIGNLLEWCKV